jgi:large subunit ribosomal protein L24
MHIKTGDIVQVTAGREKGKSGKVIKIDLARSRVTVEGLNIIKRHRKPTPADPDGGIVEREAAIHSSNVLLLSNTLNRGVRVSYRFVGAGGEYHTTRKAALSTFSEPPARVAKIRLCVKTGEVFS